MNRKDIVKAGASTLYERVRAWPHGGGEDARGQLNLGGLLPQGLMPSGSSISPVDGQANAAARYAEISEEDWDNTYGDNLAAGVWTDLAEFVVGAQNQYNVGFATSEYPERVGRWYMVLDDGAGNAVTGQARIKTRNSNDEAVETEIRGVHTRRLATDPNDFRTQYAVPEQLDTARVGEDSKVVLQFKLASASAGTSVDFTADATVNAIPLSNYS